MPSLWDDDWSDAAEQAWCVEVRPKVVDYLRTQGVVHGEVGYLPAWHLVPHASIWAVESIAQPGAIGWWVIYADLPTDFCSGEGCRHPRLALRRIVDHWRNEINKRQPDDTTIGATGIPASFADLLAARVEILGEFADDDDLWPFEVYGSVGSI